MPFLRCFKSQKTGVFHYLTGDSNDPVLSLHSGRHQAIARHLYV